MNNITEEIYKYGAKLLQWSNDQFGRHTESSELEAVFNEINKATGIIGENGGNDGKTVLGKHETVTRVMEMTHYVTHKFVEWHEGVLSHDFTFILIALILVFWGSIISVKSIPVTALPPTREHPLYDPTDNDARDECNIVEKKKKGGRDDNGVSLTSLNSEELTEWHAIILPVTAGLTLTGLYYLFKWGKLPTITTLLRYEMTFMSIFSVMGVDSSFLRIIIRYICYKTGINPLRVVPRYRITFGDDNEDVHMIGSSPYVSNFTYRDALTDELGYKETIDFLNKKGNEKLRQTYRREFKSPGDVKSKRQMGNLYCDWTMFFSLALGITCSVLFWLYPTNWLISNVVSIHIAIWSIGQINLKNLRTGVMILSVLFLYDIYFVFGTDVMVTVATNLELPVKLLLPVGKDTIDPTKFSFSLIGAGDIILPGIFISLCHKYDIWKWHLVHDDTEFHYLNFKSYLGKYFMMGLGCYTLGLSLCMICLHVFEVGQPALLYIVPCLLIGVCTMAWFNGDLGEFWNFQYDTVVVEASEQEEEEEGDEEEDETGSQEKSDVLYAELLQEEDIVIEGMEDEDGEYTAEDALRDEQAGDYEYDDDALLSDDN